MLARCFLIGVLATLPVLTSVLIVIEPPSIEDIGLCVVSWAATALFADRAGDWIALWQKRYERPAPTPVARRR